jgi:hypothetical protein
LSETGCITREEGRVYLSKDLIHERYDTEVQVLERYFFGSQKFTRESARAGWREVEIFQEEEVVAAYNRMIESREYARNIES